MSIALNPSDLERVKRLLQGIKGGAQTALTRTLNRTAQGTRTELTKQIKARYTVKSGEIKPAVKLSKAKPATLEATIEVKSPKLPLDKFKFKPKQDTTGSPHRKVTVEAIKGSPFEVKRGFVWNQHVFTRETEKRLPIRRLTGPAVAQMAGSEEVIKPVEDFASDLMRKRLDHEITVLLNGWDKKK